MERARVVRWCVLVALLALGLSTGAWGQSCPGYSFYTDTFGGRHYYLSTDPNETDLGPTCPANGGGTPVTSGGGSLMLSYAVQVTASGTFAASGQKAGTGTVTVTNTSTGIAVAGAWIDWSPNQWTYRSPGGSTDAYGQFKIAFGHVRPALVTLTAQARDQEGGTLLGSGSAQSQGYDYASGPNSFSFYAPATGQSYACRVNVPGQTTDNVPFTFGWTTYKVSPLGYEVTVNGSTGVYWDDQGAPATGQGSTSFSACTWVYLQSSGPHTAVGTLWIGYYTANGTLDYAAASQRSNSFTILLQVANREHRGRRLLLASRRAPR